MIVRSTLEIAESDWQEFASDCKRHRVQIEQSAPAMIHSRALGGSYSGPKRIAGYVVTASKEVPEGPATAPVPGPDIQYVLTRWYRGFASGAEVLATFARYGVTPSGRLEGMYEMGIILYGEMISEFIYQNLSWIRNEA